jgi:PhnB protein
MPAYTPEGYNTAIPYLIVSNADALLTFLKEAFSTEELVCARHPDGTIQHAGVRIGDSVIEMAEAGERWTPRPGAVHLYVPDADAAYQRAIQAGATSLFEPADMSYGERSGGVQDPTGNHWYIATVK